MLQVEIEAPDQSAANEAILDCFGEGSAAGTEIVNMEVLDSAELG